MRDDRGSRDSSTRPAGAQWHRAAVAPEVCRTAAPAMRARFMTQTSTHTMLARSINGTSSSARRRSAARLLAFVVVALAWIPGLALAQAPLVNGATQNGQLPVGGIDTYTFQASVNDSITLRIGEVPLPVDP